MAKTSKTNLHDAEREWYSTRVGLTFQPNTPINEMKRAFYAKSASASNGQIPIDQLEKMWLAPLTGVTSKYEGDMWREAVAGAGGTPSNSIVENKIKYFQLVA